MFPLRRSPVLPYLRGTGAGQPVNLPFDPEAPPAEPPPGCDRLMWTLAYRVHVEHQPDADGSCLATTCRGTFTGWPCDAASLAAQAFLGAVGAWAGLDLSRPETRWSANVPPPPRRGPASTIESE